MLLKPVFNPYKVLRHKAILLAKLILNNYITIKIYYIKRVKKQLDIVVIVSN